MGLISDVLSKYLTGTDFGKETPNIMLYGVKKFRPNDTGYRGQNENTLGTQEEAAGAVFLSSTSLACM